MAKKTKPKIDDQVTAFRKAARELGCSDSEEAFQEALRAVAKPRKQKLPSKAKKSQRNAD